VNDLGGGVFAFCSGLTNIDVEKDNTAYMAIDGLLYTKDGSELLTCPAGKTGAITIANLTQVVGESAFEGCSNISSVDIPNTVTKIDDHVFNSCTGLTLIDFPSSLLTINSAAFVNCTSLTSITLPASLKTIESLAFSGCTNLESVSIPASVTLIGNSAFSACENLSAIYVYVTNPAQITLGFNVFYQVPSSCKLYVPVGSEALYESAEQWNVFVVEETATGITDIETNKVQVSLSGDQLILHPGSSTVKGIKLFNMAGRQVMQMANPTSVINTGHLPTGIYIVILDTDHGQIKIKVIKN
jgi:hypothetical protein